MGKASNVKKDKEETVPVEEKATASIPNTTKLDRPVLTPAQQRVNNFVRTAEAEPPDLPDVTILFEQTRPELEVPKAVKKKGYVYCWAAIDSIENALHQYGGVWVIVTRLNHPHVPESFFGLDGAITYKGQNILCFCRESIIRMRDEKTAAAYNRKATRAAQKTSEYADGIHVEVTDFA